MKQPADSIENRAKRLRLIRQFLRLSRPALEKKYAIAACSLQNWEQGRYGGLSEKGARKVVRAFAAEGVECTMEWLLYGVGKNPITPQARPFQSKITKSHSTEAEIIAKELQTFHSLNMNAVDCVMQDDGMLPIYLPGDHLAGVRFFSSDINKAIGLSCIAQTTEGDIFVRLLEEGDISNRYNLIVINPHTTLRNVKNIELLSVAPILWMRRKGIN
jgi:hypothetical protein